MVVTGPTATSRSGFRAFLIVSAGQLVSGLGSTMSAFAVQFWVYAETDSVTNLAMIALAYTIPQVIISPFAGALVDRWDRRVVMLGADVVAAAVTAALALLYAADLLAVGHVIASVAVIGITSTFQQPAWMASIPLLVRKEQLGRANGLGQLIGGVTAVLAPLLAGAVLQFSSLQGVLLVDLATFAAAVITLAIVRFPRPAPAPAAQRRSLRAEAIHGWRFVRERPGLLGLLWTVGGVNFSLTFFNVLLLPLVLTIASNDGAAGAVLAVTGAGAIVGAAAVSAWGGPKRKVRGMMMTIAVAGVFIAVAGMRPSLVVVSATCFAVVAVIPVANTASQVIWQTKVPLEMQGRVFAIRRMISESITPLAFLIAGPLADNVFEPLLAADGGLAESIGALIGTGAGRGIGFMYLLTGLATAAMALYGYSRPRIRHLETELPDQVGEAAAPAPA
jgi:MFS family permease